MSQILAVLGSVTVASRLFREMERHGCINCAVVRTPTKISSGDCSYSVRLEEKYLKMLDSVASKHKIKGIYREILKEGELEYDSLSR